jgi:hypothetical protein
MSGIPYMTGSDILAQNKEHRLEFPTVAKSVTVINVDPQGADVHVHFCSKFGPPPSTTSNWVSGGMHYIPLQVNRDAITINARCKELYVSHGGDKSTNAVYVVYAELTGISTDQMAPLTGSGLTDDLGAGWSVGG